MPSLRRRHRPLTALACRLRRLVLGNSLLDIEGMAGAPLARIVEALRAACDVIRRHQLDAIGPGPQEERVAEVRQCDPDRESSVRAVLYPGPDAVVGSCQYGPDPRQALGAPQVRQSLVAFGRVSQGQNRYGLPSDSGCRCVATRYPRHTTGSRTRSRW